MLSWTPASKPDTWLIGMASSACPHGCLLSSTWSTLPLAGSTRSPSEPAYIAVSRADMIGPAFLDLGCPRLGLRDQRDGFHLPDLRDCLAVRDLAVRSAPPFAGRQQLDGCLVAGDELGQGLLGRAQVLELRLGAGQPDRLG